MHPKICGGINRSMPNVWSLYCRIKLRKIKDKQYKLLQRNLLMNRKNKYLLLSGCFGVKSFHNPCEWWIHWTTDSHTHDILEKKRFIQQLTNIGFTRQVPYFKERMSIGTLYVFRIKNIIKKTRWKINKTNTRKTFGIHTQF